MKVGDGLVVGTFSVSVLVSADQKVQAVKLKSNSVYCDSFPVLVGYSTGLRLHSKIKISESKMVIQPIESKLFD